MLHRLAFTKHLSHHTTTWPDVRRDDRRDDRRDPTVQISRSKGDLAHSSAQGEWDREGRMDANKIH